MKKMIFLTMVLLAIVSGQVFAANKTVSIQFTENPGNQVFDGGQLIGPYKTDSSNWNSTNFPTTGDKTAGTIVDLIDSSGDAIGIDIAWSSGGTYWGAGGGGGDEHKLAVGYLDDGGSGVTVTLTNIPYATYTICGLYASDSGTGAANYDVNGAWALGGDAATTADTYKNINENVAANGENWTLIEPGVTIGNYWLVEATGETCVITAAARSGNNRGSLAGIIIETDQEAPIYQRSISSNYQWSVGGPGGWGYHMYLSRSSNPKAGYADPNGVFLQQIPSSTWNEGTHINDTYKAQDEAGNLGTAIVLNTGDFKWGSSWYKNLDWDIFEEDNPDQGTVFISPIKANAVAPGATEEDIWAYENAKNKARVATGFIGHNGSQPKKPLTTMKKVPYGDYMVVAYMHPNRSGDQQEIQIEDQSFFYLDQNGTAFKESLFSDPNDGGWLVAEETTSPATQTANVAIFRHLSDKDMVLIFDTPANSGVSAYSIVSEVDPEDIVTQILPGNIDKDYGDTPASVTTDLTWNAPVNGADSYDVYLGLYDGEDPNFYLVESGNTTGSYTPTLAYNGGYVWKVDTVRGGETISGDYFYFDVEGDPLLQVQPNSVSVQAGTDTFFTVGALLTDNYEWWYSADAAVDTPEDDVLLQSGPDATVNITNATDGVDTGYYYVILTNTIPDSVAVVSEVASLEIGKLEVHLPFDGDATDASGNGWDADYGNVMPDPIDPNFTVPSMGTVSFQTGYDGVGQAVKFTRDSGDQLVIPGSEDYFNFYPKGFTIRFWVKPTDYTGLGGFMCYIAKGNSGWRMFDTAFYYGSGFEARVYPLGANTPPGRLDDGNWHMVAATYDGATQEMKIYQEGFLQNTLVGALNDVSGNTNPISIGSYNLTGTGGWGYSGLIDDVEIFSYAISEREMLDDYAAKTGLVLCLNERVGDVDDDCQVGVSDLAAVGGEWLDSTIPGSATPGQVSRVVSWQFDETDGLVATDSSGNGINGTLAAGFVGGQWIVDGGRTGVAGDNALYINGDPNTSVIATVADANSFPSGAGDIFKGTSSWTMNIWVKLFTAEMNNIGGFGQNEWLDPSTESDRYFASWDGGLEVELGQTGLFPSNSMGSEWNMLTATYDGTTCTVYFNGVQVSQTDVVLVDTLVNEINLNTARRVLWSGVDATVPMNGHVDDFSIWSEAFTAEQVAGMYANSFPSCDGAIDADLNGDCVANLADSAIVAADWLKCDLVPGSLCD